MRLARVRYSDTPWPVANCRPRRPGEQSTPSSSPATLHDLALTRRISVASESALGAPTATPPPPTTRGTICSCVEACLVFLVRAPAAANTHHEQRPLADGGQLRKPNPLPTNNLATKSTSTGSSFAPPPDWPSRTRDPERARFARFRAPQPMVAHALSPFQESPRAWWWWSPVNFLRPESGHGHCHCQSHAVVGHNGAARRGCRACYRGFAKGGVLWARPDTAQRLARHVLCAYCVVRSSISHCRGPACSLQLWSFRASIQHRRHE